MSSKRILSDESISSLSDDDKEAMNRWRLILGKKAEDHDINFSPDKPPEDNEEEEEEEEEKEEEEEQEEKEKDKGTGEEVDGEGEDEGEEEEGNGAEEEAEGDEKGKGEGKEGGEEEDSDKEAEDRKNKAKYASGKTKGKGIGKSSKGLGGIKRNGKGKPGKGKSKKAGSAQQADFNKNKLAQMDQTLEMVYGQPQDQRRSAGLGSSNLSIPNWIQYVNEFFPKDTKEVLEKDLVERSDIKDLIKNPELFEKVEPSIEMVKTIISLKNMLPNQVKDIARNVVRKVVEQLKDKFKDDVEKHIIGAIKRDMHTPIKVYRNIDWKDSIRRNLKHYDPTSKKLIMAEPRFYSAEKKKKPWQIVILIDESGSMTNSIIYSVVIASIFASLPAMHTNLIIFDTQVVDLSEKVDDPVEVLMTVQLGGGTNIAKAVQYGQSLIKNPKKTIMVIISDFYEGGGYPRLTRTLKQVLEGQTKILGIAALDYHNEPMYDRNYARKLNQLGIDVLASTPNNLAEIIAKLMK